MLKEGNYLFLSNQVGRGGESMEIKTTGRNKMDTIMDLIALHIKQAEYQGDSVTPEEIEQLFEKYYRLILNK